MKNLLFVFLFLTGLSFFSQNRERLDSLLRTEKNIREDTNGIKHLIKTAKQLKKNNPDSALLYTVKAEKLAWRLNSNLFILKSLYEKINIIRNSGEVKKLVDTLNKGLQLAEKFKEPVFISRMDLDLGVAYRKLGNYDKSVKHLLSALQLAQQNNYKSDVYNALNSLANTYSQAGFIKKSPPDLLKALEYYKKAFEVSDKSNLNVQAMIYNNLGVTYFNLGQVNVDSLATKMAIEYYEKALKIRTDEKDSIGMSTDYNNLGGAYHVLCDLFGKPTYFDIAMQNFEKALEIDNRINSPEKYSNQTNYAGHLTLVGTVRKDKQLMKKAVSVLKEAKDVALINKDMNVTLSIYEGLSYAYESLGNKDSALLYLHKYVAIKDTLLTDENKQVAEELVTKYESDLKDAENNNLKQQAELREEVISKKSNTIKLMVGTSVIMLGLIVVVFISRQKINKSRELIRVQQIETERQKLLIEEKQKEIVDSINYSKRLQDAAIPSMEYFKSLLPESFVYYKPKDIVAGDFYWIHKLKNSNSVLVAAADCTGHGVPGALVSIVCLNALNRCIDEYNLTEPSTILDKAAEIIQQSFRQSENDVKDGMDIALCLLDLDNYKGLFAGANNPVWILRGNTVNEIKGDNQPVGQQHIPKPFTLHSFDMEKGDTILLATDGYADQFGGPKGKKLKTKKFKEIFPELNTMDITSVNSKISSLFDDWKGRHEQVDDVLVIGIRIT